MRARNIKPGFFKNEDLAELGPYGQLLFAGLWCLADRDGKLEDRVKRITAEIFPYGVPNPSTDELLNLLQSKNFITRYETERVKVIKIENFKIHQRPHPNENKSIFPDPTIRKSNRYKEKTSNQGTKSFIPRQQALRSSSLNPSSLNPSSLNPSSLNPESLITSPSDNGKLSPSSLAELWNSLKPPCLPAVILPISQSRIKKALPAIKERNDPEFWKDLILSMADTPFLLGGNDRGWRADFDFILKSYDKISEGKYKSETRISSTGIKNMQVMKEWLGEEKKDEPEKQD